MPSMSNDPLTVHYVTGNESDLQKNVTKAMCHHVNPTITSYQFVWATGAKHKSKPQTMGIYLAFI